MKTNNLLPGIILLLTLLPFVSLSQQNASNSLYNNQGVLIQQGKTINNSKSGEWIELSQDYKFILRGSFIKPDIFTGIQANPNTNSDIFLLYVVDNNEMQPDSIFWATSISDVLGKLKLKASNDSFLVKRYDWLNGQHNSDEIIQLQVPVQQSLLRNLFIEELFWGDFLTKEKSLKEIQAALSKPDQIQIPGFASEIEAIQKQITAINADTIFPSRLERYQKLKESFEQYQIRNNQCIERLQTIDQLVNENSAKLSKLLPGDFGKAAGQLQHRRDSLTQLDPELMLAASDAFFNELQASLRKLDACGELKQSTEAMLSKLNTFNKTEQSNLFNLSVVPFIQKVENNSFQSADQYQMTCHALLDEGNQMIAQLEAIEIVGKSIVEESKSIGNRYLQSYPPIYKKEVKPLSDKINEALQLTIIDEKHATLQKLADSLKYYSNAFALYQSTDSLISGSFALFSEKINLEDKAIYKSNIPPLEAQIKNYKIADVSIGKTIKANDFASRYTNLIEAYDKLSSQKISIDSIMPLVSKSYQEAFMPIYKTEVSLLLTARDEYLKIPQLDIRYTRGETILADFKRYHELHAELINQNQLLLNRINEVEVNYMPVFPKIVKDELSEVKKDYKIYEHIEFTDKKILKGKYITEQLDTMLCCIKELEKNEIRLQSELPSMMLQFKKDFPLVYKMNIEPLEAIQKEYTSAGYHQRKLTLSRTLIQALDENSKKLESISNQQNNIKKSFEEFETFFQSKNQEKYLYKRTKSIFEELYSEYEKEADPKIKTEKGTQIQKILDKVNDMRGKDNTRFNDEIKDAKDRLKYFEVISRY